MITPKYLQKGDCIAIVAPAGKIEKSAIENARKKLESWDLNVKIGEHLFDDYFQYSGRDKERRIDFQLALNDPDVKAILCARGGYGSIRIIDEINFKSFLANPKWIIGFSDITVLHSYIHEQLGIESLHGTMAAGIYDDNPASESLKTALFGKALEYKFKSNSLSRSGKCRGMLVGGNLAILSSLLGSNSAIDTQNKILFIEDVGEHLYRIDRMLWSLKRAGKLDKLAGLIVGGMTDISDTDKEFGKTAYEIVHEHVQDYNYPLCFDFPAGHQNDNRALIFGRSVRLKVGRNSELSFL